MPELTPMMAQYQEMKKQYPESILFFRLGDFYEMFGDDAILASQELELTLTTRDRGKKNKPKEEQLPMCGIPYQASDTYIGRLIAKGYKVAICDQMEDPAQAKGLVRREITRVVTPGTVIDSDSLDERKSNYLCSAYLDSHSAGVAFCDVTTGEVHLTAFSGKSRVEHLLNEFSRFSPAEALLNDGAFSEPLILDLLREKIGARVENGGEGRFLRKNAEENIIRQFGQDALLKIPADEPGAIPALGALLHYLHELQKQNLSHINHLEYYERSRFMELDLTARRNLELTETLRSKERKGSLLWVLDRTKTPMGGRMLRSWMERPLLDVTAISKRNTTVAALVHNTICREELIAALTGLGDMERLISRIVYATAGGRELLALRNAIDHLPGILEQSRQISCRRMQELTEELDTLEEISQAVTERIDDEPPVSVREGGVIRTGFHPEVDRLRNILNGGKDLLTQLEAREKERTGIRTLRVRYNKVFGYYIEVSNSFRDKVPEDYIRKQTLANGERFVTQELKDLEHEILTASDRVTALEYELFSQLRNQIAEAAAQIQKTAAVVAEIDTLVALADVAVRNQYCCPDIDYSNSLDIRDGRHPVVERMLKDSLFVPNDTVMGEQEQRVAIITGPNMAGKSTYMRQVALIVLMAQMGSFVPASQARIGIIDRIFTRIGASDDLSAGQSTFMVEMSEVAGLLHHATRQSLLILDEIGRGTSIFDGMSIARAVLEYCAGRKLLGAKTLFATHYHELTELENTLPGVVNYSVAVKIRGEDIIFLRKVMRGSADRSYGIEVARLAGIPERVIRRAKEILKELETQTISPSSVSSSQEEQISLGSIREEEVLDTLRRCQPEQMTPMDAMRLLYELKQKLEQD